MHHPVVGDPTLTGEALALPDDSGLTIIAYTVEPGSPSEQALGFLASWADDTAFSDQATRQRSPAES